MSASDNPTKTEFRPLVQAELMLAVVLERADGQLRATPAEIERARHRKVETWTEVDASGQLGDLVAVLHV